MDGTDGNCGILLRVWPTGCDGRSRMNQGKAFDIPKRRSGSLQEG